ncbi:hypothetical protein A3D42_01415 [Candidatus Nomurabacteria bacterium RIFCSPHIGHO2_02_FULL_41_18]|uniref:Uncharacterized protein n=1 Tax=Candidatus Nomurabacteria bacterium RIFCSPHIGHO2_02_FULL_41_18 TaxID=1801754 RepID=A0A1F6W7R8_9BACT|nr:MAG: hypothetical protein A2737_00385 [Candidatus Nomurabacteria bacterium RIFCSPHIGHO2_01_FULL_41_71]OGI77852.1 MAG: hypothetical protein A3D42_01415 [Candidatus Nomurabacteria bacterium RIFCSPHIGHO2_02_FULL_41_18]OGI90044.1 MAG: hypothetical protein A3B01_02215 [Candidatus Nomurabacteria bacterium RIFCSPLOWO2_01_FULL_41_52b]
MKKYFHKIKYNQAFTLVETLVAISVFSLSVIALMSVLATGISDTVYAKKKITAAYLAQEGIEYVRNIRDTYTLYSATGAIGWAAFNTKMTGAGARCHQANGCYLDDRDLNYGNQTQPMTGIYVIACGSSCAPLLYNSATGKYGYAAGSDSGFVRKISVSLTSANETKVFSTVSWTQGSGNYQITFSESLFNWVE